MVEFQKYLLTVQNNRFDRRNLMPENGSVNGGAGRDAPDRPDDNDRGGARESKEKAKRKRKRQTPSIEPSITPTGLIARRLPCRRPQEFPMTMMTTKPTSQTTAAFSIASPIRSRRRRPTLRAIRARPRRWPIGSETTRSATALMI